MATIITSDGLATRYLSEAFDRQMVTMQTQFDDLKGRHDGLVEAYLAQSREVSDLKTQSAVQDVLLKCAQNPNLCATEGPDAP